MLAFSKTNEDDLLVIWSQITVQYSNRPGARVVGFGGGEGAKKTFGGTLTRLRPDAFEMPQQSDEHFAPNPMLSSFGMDFALKFGGKTKKGFHRKILGYFTRSVLLFHRKKKRLWWPVFGQKFAGPLVLVQKFTLAWKAQAVIWGCTAQKAPPTRA